jgi:hypothetical protein
MRWSIVLVMLTGLMPALVSAGEAATTYYVQLIRGTDTPLPPVPGCKPAGPRLSSTLSPVFRWKGYWEIERQQVTVVPGQKARVRLHYGREAEIDLTSPSQRRVAAFHNGRLVDRTILPTGKALTIIGGKRDPQSVWFIVVRRDQPGP